MKEFENIKGWTWNKDMDGNCGLGTYNITPHSTSCRTQGPTRQLRLANNLGNAEEDKPDPNSLTVDCVITETWHRTKC